MFAGIGPLADEIDKVENIKNVGFQQGEKLVELIQKARFSVYPSEWYENCPFSVMESEIYGTPVLGAEIGGIPELIEDGITGELFESGNEQDLIKHIKSMWQKNEILSQYAANCKSVQYDTIEEYAEKLVKIYS